MKLNCINTCKNETKTKFSCEEKCVLIIYQINFCEQTTICLKLSV